METCGRTAGRKWSLDQDGRPADIGRASGNCRRADPGKHDTNFGGIRIGNGPDSCIIIECRNILIVCPRNINTDSGNILIVISSGNILIITGSGQRFFRKSACSVRFRQYRQCDPQ